METYDVTIIGGGVTGTALLYVISKYSNIKKTSLIEKYDQAGKVQSSRKSNSQTLHFGDIETNYSLDKAKTVKISAEMVARYVEKNNKNLFKKFHKMVLGVGDEEAAFLEKRYQEFKDIFPNLKLIMEHELAKIEPKVVEGRDPKERLSALYSPDGYAIDFGELAQSWVNSSKKTNKKTKIFLNNKVLKISKEDDYYLIKTNKTELKSKTVVVAASGHSLYFAHQLGYGKDLILLPVAGSFFWANQQLNGKVYTVQKPKIPFAAVHGDPDVNTHHQTRFGPTAKVLPMLERYNYESAIDFLRLFRFRLDATLSLINIISDPIYFKFILKNVLYDLPILGRFFFLKEVRKIIPSLKLQELHYGKGLGGIRPQIVDIKTKSITLGEAKIVGDGIIFNITPSPGASVCLGNAETDVKKLVEFLGKDYSFDQDKFNQDLRTNNGALL